MKQKLNNLIFLLVFTLIATIPFILLNMVLIFIDHFNDVTRPLCIPLCIAVGYVVFIILKKSKFIARLLSKTSYIRNPKISKKKIRTSTIITSILIIVVAMTTSNILKKETRTFIGYTIDEVLQEKYPEYDSKYINYDNYYYVILENADARESFGKIIRYNDKNKYEFDLIMGKFGNKVLMIEETADFFIIYKDKEDNYLLRIMFTTNDLSQGKIKIYDNDDTWQYIETSDGTRNYFKVISNIEDDYKITIEGYGNVYNVTKKDIVGLFN